MEQNKGWDNLRKAYQRHGLVLALGAGVSKGCKLPNWEELLRAIAENHSDTRGRLFDSLKSDGYTLPAIASMLETVYTKEDFSKIIWKQLYENFDFSKGINSENRAKFIESVKDNNKTLATVAGLCVCKDGRNGYLPNPRIHAIVNFNFDSVFRAYVKTRYNNSHLLRSIERPSEGSIYDSIPVYYMHGFFRFDKDIDDFRHGAPDLRVFHGTRIL
jgi:hypothetical protein